MTNVGTSVSVAVNVGTYDSGALEVARDCLQGYSGDYFMFQYSDTVYLLVLCEDDYSYSTTGYFTASNPVVIQIEAVTNTSVKSHTVSGTFSGSVYDRFSGSYYTDETETAYFCTSFQASGIQVTNPRQFLTYGSFDHMPHLIEGVENYAYFQTLLFVCVILFSLVDRIFRRVF